MPLFLPRLSGFLQHLKWLALALYQPLLGGQYQDPGGTPEPFPQVQSLWDQVIAGKLNTGHYASKNYKQG